MLTPRIAPLLATVLLALPLRGAAQTAPEPEAWSGSFVVAAPDGKLQHDTAVVVLHAKGTELTGSAGSTIDKQSPIVHGTVTGNQYAFHLDAGGGMDFLLVRSGDTIRGTAKGTNFTADLTLAPAPGLEPHDQLVAEIQAADRALFEAFAACDATKFASYFAPSLEFYQDRIGVRGFDATMASFRQRCAEGIVLRREIDTPSLIINSSPGAGAIQAGTHRFFARQPDGSERLDATAQFVNIWSKQSGTWKIVRAVSFNHH
jgi:ketosteroid isomerase-like protein